MVSNHRLVLFTHALCRLSYPAVGGETNGPDISGLSKIAHFQKRWILPPDGCRSRPIECRIDAAGDRLRFAREHARPNYNYVGIRPTVRGAIQSHIRLRRSASSSRAKLELRSAPPAYRSGALGIHNRWRHDARIGSGHRAPGRDFIYGFVCGPVQLSSACACGWPTRRSAIVSLRMLRAFHAAGRRPPGRKPRTSGGRRPRRCAFHETGRRGETHSRNREA
jgi:hypothetical protein